MRILIIIVWLLLGVFYWYASTLCCAIQKEKVEITAVENAVSKPCPPLSNITYQWDDMTPTFQKDWITLRDSVLSGLKEDQLIQITGLYRKEEKTPAGFENLGLARANEIFNKFELNENNARASSKLVSLNDTSKECLLNGINFRYVINSTKIKEIDDRTLIYFPYNSTRKLNDLEVEKYLDNLVEKVQQTNERILLTGHTDNSGDPASNMKLGLYRAQVIENYLLSKGVDPSLIESKTEGEENPVATNETKEGRAKNRRTELILLK